MLTLLVSLTLIFTVFSYAQEIDFYKSGKGKPAFVEDEIVVTFNSAMDKKDVSRILKKYDLTKKRDSWKKGKFSVLKVKKKGRSIRDILQEIQREPGVVSVEQDAYAYLAEIPNDPYYSPQQWHLSRIRLESAWDISTGSGVVVAVIDTGVRQDLSDLANTNFTAGYNFVELNNDPTDVDDHGTHVCGTIAQSTNNGTGCAGVAYNCTIMPIRACYIMSRIADGIYYAVDNGADIINISQSGGDITAVREAVDYAWDNGVLVVCSAGNMGNTTLLYPAAYPNTISVSAINSLDQKAWYSNYGATIDICAPGGDEGDHNGDGYQDGVYQQTFDSATGTPGYYFKIGTSMAAPHVAGVAALVKSVAPHLTHAQIRDVLESTADDLGTPGRDDSFGYGLVNAYEAVHSVLSASDISIDNQALGGSVNIYDDLTVKWTCTRLAGQTVRAYLIRPGVTIDTIGDYVVPSDLHTFTVNYTIDPGLEPAGDYMIKVRNLAHTVYDISDRFSIVNAQITVACPPKSLYRHSEKIPVSWTSTLNTGFVKVYLIQKGGTFSHYVGKYNVNTSSINISIPAAAPNDKYWIKVRKSDDGGVYGKSCYFSIIN